ncbi:DUF6510 family protein [Kribbella shirazensis]|uniref:NAD-dependent SIR2 family protein deacetylase n=1 Tax=Kribbella shirazensis TaxID=1105143 RepID=A0A7X6A361_9ACTN|nr:DUF6510 family protein [Kribbella shirazensis]NIK60032.1 NAD-dependent SIR2 family protein deacetylase [Kribbella shirazensis]
MSQANYLDGNAAAGALSEVFAVDLTTAVGQCNGCGQTAVFAEARVYVDAPGMVARCNGCESVLLRVVTTPHDTYLDLRGLTYLRVPNS